MRRQASLLFLSCPPRGTWGDKAHGSVTLLTNRTFQKTVQVPVLGSLAHLINEGAGKSLVHGTSVSPMTWAGWASSSTEAHCSVERGFQLWGAE